MLPKLSSSSFLICVLLLFSCSKDNPVTPETSSLFVKVKPGSTFTYDEYSIDSAEATIAGSQHAVVSTVLRTDGAVAGKTGVIVVQNVRGVEMDTSYYAYEANNNLSVLASDGNPNDGIWETMPTGTGTAIVRQTEFEFIGIDTSVTRDSTITSFVGTENMNINGQSVEVKKMQMTFRHVVLFNRVKILDVTVNNYLYYAPSLGFFAKTISTARKDPFLGGWIDGVIQTLIDYDLK